MVDYINVYTILFSIVLVICVLYFVRNDDSISWTEIILFLLILTMLGGFARGDAYADGYEDGINDTNCIWIKELIEDPDTRLSFENADSLDCDFPIKDESETPDTVCVEGNCVTDDKEPFTIEHA